ncbi:MAG: hypothetical protein H7Y20_01100 [Bryobacteraceae bacterium]|nr:hypothetical protein [Bryobacteraceae bacterium]
MKAAAAIVCIAAACCSCVPTPQSYTIPDQHKPVADGPKPVYEFGEFVRANDSTAERYFVKGIRGLESSAYRWTLAEPEFRFTLKSAKDRRFRIEFGISDRTLEDTGPLNIVFLVNGHELDRVKYTTFGDKVFEKRVPEEWLNATGENRVLVRVLNPWQAPDPGVKLGVLLLSAGFVS